MFRDLAARTRVEPTCLPYAVLFLNYHLAAISAAKGSLTQQLEPDRIGTSIGILSTRCNLARDFFDVRLAIEFNRKYSVAFVGRNLTSERTPSAVGADARGASTSLASYKEPRSAWLRPTRSEGPEVI